MNIPPYWARERFEGVDRDGRPRTFTASGWSFSSLADAQAAAVARAQRIFDHWQQRRWPDPYEYHDRPVREEIVRELHDGGSRIGLVTRNRYGALVLNTPGVLFADVDFPRAQPAGLLASLGALFSARRRAEQRDALIRETRGRLERWADQNGSRGFRLYRTREGFRLLFTDRLYDPAAPETTSLLRELGTDPMYIRLTQKQACFRARLTPKPWRCGCPRPPGTFPWADAAAEASCRAWEAEYARKHASYKVCELSGQYGPALGDPAIHGIIAAHDADTRTDADAPLA